MRIIVYLQLTLVVDDRPIGSQTVRLRDGEKERVRVTVYVKDPNNGLLTRYLLPKSVVRESNTLEL